MPKKGFEPSRTSRRLLRPLCLPFHHFGVRAPSPVEHGDIACPQATLYCTQKESNLLQTPCKDVTSPIGTCVHITGRSRRSTAVPVMYSSQPTKIIRFGRSIHEPYLLRGTRTHNHLFRKQERYPLRHEEKHPKVTLVAEQLLPAFPSRLSAFLERQH